MYSFTPRAQKTLLLARQEAERLNHNYIGTEHLLLGLLSLGQGVYFNVLMKLGLDLENTRAVVEKQVGVDPDQKPSGKIAYTPLVKKVMALAAKDAKALNHAFIGTEHILLGILAEGEGTAVRVLQHFNVDIKQVRLEILRELTPKFGQ